MKIHSPNAHRRVASRRSDFFYNYFTLGMVCSCCVQSSWDRAVSIVVVLWVDSQSRDISVLLGTPSPLFSQYLGLKQLGHEADLMFLSSAEVKNGLRCTSVPCLHRCGVHRDNFPCALLCVQPTATLETQRPPPPTLSQLKTVPPGHGCCTLQVRENVAVLH